MLFIVYVPSICRSSITLYVFVLEAIDSMRMTGTFRENYRFERCPGGTDENSPGFQPWVCAGTGGSPEGTAEAAKLNRPFGTRCSWGTPPRVETLGYCQLSLRDRVGHEPWSDHARVLAARTEGSPYPKRLLGSTPAICTRAEGASSAFGVRLASRAARLVTASSSALCLVAPNQDSGGDNPDCSAGRGFPRGAGRIRQLARPPWRYCAAPAGRWSR